MSSHTPIEVLLIGAGNRGTHAYAPYALQFPDELKFTAVAEPDEGRRAHFAQLHNIPRERQFASWQEALSKPQLARAAMNCTMDKVHFESSIAALNAGYDMLLEKPMATTAEECRELVRVAEANHRLLQICHVLRFTDFFSTLHAIVRSGRLGRIITIDHRENVSYWHMSHSFVRGNWRNTAESAPMILAKCCHDMDALVWVLGKRVQRLSSFGALTHYKGDQAPPNAPLRCTDGCPIENTCPWYAPKLYGAIEGVPPVSMFMVSAMAPDRDTAQARWQKLQTGPYGRCVYHCDNDVVDHQVMNMQFEDDVTCTFTMHGHSEREGRTLRWDGSRATLFGDFSHGRPFEIRIHDHGNEDNPEIIRFDDGAGHGGGDEGLMRNFVKALRGETTPHQTTARVSLQSHLMCFAAEESRLSGRMVELSE
jgi:predicted dehydrogenase